MSDDDNLADAFGQPARSLSTMLPPRRRRTPRFEEPSTAPNGPERGGPDQRALSAVPADDDETPSRSSSSRDATDRPRVEAQSSSAATARQADRPTATPPASIARDDRTTTSTRRGTPRPGGRSATPVASDDHTSYQVVVYVHPSVKTVATTQRRDQKVSNAEIAFDAIDAVQHRLEPLIKTRRLQNRPDSSLFPGRVRRGRVSGGGAAAAAGEARRVLWGFRATGQELAVIDRLVERSGAESRSELVATALEEVLLQASANR